MPAMDHLILDSGASDLSDASLSWSIMQVCNNLQNAVAITYIFTLQQPTILACNFLHFYFTRNNRREMKTLEYWGIQIIQKYMQLW